VTHDVVVLEAAPCQELQLVKKNKK
jgi:hypothetical protein